MNNMQKRIYISLPISGYDIDERINTAMKVDVRLRGAGYDTFNPLGEQWEKGLTTHDYMRRNIEGLLYCDAVVFLEGWNKDADCHTEFCVAKAIGIEIFFEETFKTLNLK